MLVLYLQHSHFIKNYPNIILEDESLLFQRFYHNSSLCGSLVSVIWSMANLWNAASLLHWAALVGD
jgi:hypothetical protein